MPSWLQADQPFDWSRIAPLDLASSTAATPTGTSGSNWLLAAIVASVAALGIALLRLPRRRPAAASIEMLRAARGSLAFVGLACIGWGLEELLFGFHAGRMHYLQRRGHVIWISYSEHAVFFGVLGVLYSGVVLFGLLALKATFSPQVAKAPLIKHPRVVGLAWLAGAILTISAIVFLR
jgi:hypothetical protein